MCAVVYVIKSAVCIIWWGYYIWQNRIRDREQVSAGISDADREKANTIAVESDKTDKGESDKIRGQADGQRTAISGITLKPWFRVSAFRVSRAYDFVRPVLGWLGDADPEAWRTRFKSQRTRVPLSAYRSAVPMHTYR
jgi:hypothetical protein